MIFDDYTAVIKLASSQEFLSSIDNLSIIKADWWSLSHCFFVFLLPVGVTHLGFTPAHCDAAFMSFRFLVS